MKNLHIILLLITLSGCTLPTVSGLSCRSDFEIGQRCFVYDPILKKQVTITMSHISVACTPIDKKKQSCAYTYTDDLNSTWTGTPFIEVYNRV